MTHPPIRVALADDHSMVRQALAATIECEPDLQVIAQAGSCQETLALLREQPPDVLVLDYHMPDGGALDVLEEHARLQHPDVQVLVLTVNDSVHYALRTIEAGASGFLIKSSAVEELVEGIRTVRRGELYVTPKYRREVLDHLRSPRRDRVGLAALSPREFEILRELAAGKSLKETAFTHKIGVSTVSTYRSRILKKLGLDSTSELIRFALENDILS